MNRPDGETIARLLDGRATPEELRALDAVWRVDEEARLEFLTAAAIESQMAATLGALRAARTAPAASEPDLTQRHPMHWAWIPLAAAAALVVAVGIGRLFFPFAPVTPPAPAAIARPEPPIPEPMGQFVQVKGTIEIVAHGTSASETLVQEGDPILAGNTVRTGPKSEAVLRLADGTTVHLYAATVITLSLPEPRSRVFDLPSGAADFNVHKQEPGECFQVTTPSLVTRVVGTEFRVLREGDKTWVGVRKGTVGVLRPKEGTVTRVEAGYYTANAPYWVFGPTAKPFARCPYWRAQCSKMTGKADYQ